MEMMKRNTETEDPVQVAGTRLFVKSQTGRPTAPQLTLTTNNGTKPSSFELAPPDVDQSPSLPARVEPVQQ